MAISLTGTAEGLEDFRRQELSLRQQKFNEDEAKATREENARRQRVLDEEKRKRQEHLDFTDGLNLFWKDAAGVPVGTPMELPTQHRQVLSKMFEKDIVKAERARDGGMIFHTGAGETITRNMDGEVINAHHLGDGWFAESAVENGVYDDATDPGYKGPGSDANPSRKATAGEVLWYRGPDGQRHKALPKGFGEPKGQVQLPPRLTDQDVRSSIQDLTSPEGVLAAMDASPDILPPIKAGGRTYNPSQFKEAKDALKEGRASVKKFRDGYTLKGLKGKEEKATAKANSDKTEAFAAELDGLETWIADMESANRVLALEQKKNAAAYSREVSAQERSGRTPDLDAIRKKIYGE